MEDFRIIIESYKAKLKVGFTYGCVYSVVSLIIAIVCLVFLPQVLCLGISALSLSLAFTIWFAISFSRSIRKLKGLKRRFEYIELDARLREMGINAAAAKKSITEMFLRGAEFIKKSRPDLFETSR